VENYNVDMTKERYLELKELLGGELEFKDTSEFVYLSTLCGLFDTLFGMIGREELSENQLETLLPQLNHVNDVLNADRKTLETKRNRLN
jgi:hypothetical protein